MMDRREPMRLPGSPPYFLQQGTTASTMGLQGLSHMNFLSATGANFQSHAGGNLMGSSLPLDTSHRISLGGSPAIAAGPPPGMIQGEPVKKKRGRPRKYGRDGAASLASSPSTTSAPPSAKPNQKRRGRPRGTGRKQQVSLGGSFLNGPAKIVPHIINVAAGEDIKGKILSFAQAQKSIVILSGNGITSSVNIRIASAVGNVTYEGRFDILSLSGSYAQDDANAPQGPTGCLNVTLAGPDGRVLGGAVEGFMLAGTPVQIIVANLLPRTAKTKSNAGGASASHAANNASSADP